MEEYLSMNRSARVPALAAFVIVLASCSPLTIENVQYDWPVESVLTVKADNTVTEGHHALTFSVASIAEEEFQDSTALKGKAIRLLRNVEGYYFVTGKGFHNVYVFRPAPHELQMRSKIEVSPDGLKNPAMNQRPPYIELVDGSAAPKKLTSDEVVKEQ
jgi:hypothetical protein